MLVAAAAITVNAALVPFASVSPLNRAAVMTAPVCAVVSVRPLAVHEPAPAAIVQLVVPVKGPVPVVSENETCVAEATLVGAPAAFLDSTVTANPVPALTG